MSTKPGCKLQLEGVLGREGLPSLELILQELTVTPVARHEILVPVPDLTRPGFALIVRTAGPIQTGATAHTPPIILLPVLHVADGDAVYRLE